MDLSNKQNKPEKTVSGKKETVFIYVDPNTRAISRFTIFRNGYPPQLKEDLEKFPLLKNLFINPEDLPAFLKNVEVPGTFEHTWFNEAKKYFSGAVNQ